MYPKIKQGIIPPFNANKLNIYIFHCIVFGFLVELHMLMIHGGEYVGKY